jgi:hypothetical protein
MLGLSRQVDRSYRGSGTFGSSRQLLAVSQGLAAEAMDEVVIGQPG